ncbi:MAG: hypothetical protein ACRCXM_09710, partial [Beijerinckiaceae bacterium]
LLKTRASMSVSILSPDFSLTKGTPIYGGKANGGQLRHSLRKAHLTAAPLTARVLKKSRFALVFERNYPWPGFGQDRGKSICQSSICLILRPCCSLATWTACRVNG